MRTYLILGAMDEDKIFGRAWWRVEAHSAPAAVEDCAHLVEQGEVHEVYDITDNPPTLVGARVDFEEIEVTTP